MRAYLAAFVLIFAFSRCTKDPPLWTIHNLSGDSVYVVGHGGMGIKSIHPLNSEASLREALLTGADGTEMDVQLSADSQLVIFHGKDLDEETRCSGAVRTLDAPAITACAYRGVDGEHVCSLEEFVRKVPDTKILTFDCKDQGMDDGFDALFARRLAGLIRAYNLEHRCIVESPLPSVIREVHAQLPEVAIFLYTDSMSIALKATTFLPITGVVIDRLLVNASDINAAHAHGLKVSLFGIATEDENVDAIRLSPDMIETDKLKAAVKVLKDR